MECKTSNLTYTWAVRQMIESAKNDTAKQISEHLEKNYSGTSGAKQEVLADDKKYCELVKTHSTYSEFCHKYNLVMNDTSLSNANKKDAFDKLNSEASMFHINKGADPDSLLKKEKISTTNTHSNGKVEPKNTTVVNKVNAPTKVEKAVDSTKRKFTLQTETKHKVLRSVVTTVDLRTKSHTVTNTKILRTEKGLEIHRTQNIRKAVRCSIGIKFENNKYKFIEGYGSKTYTVLDIKYINDGKSREIKVGQVQKKKLVNTALGRNAVKVENAVKKTIKVVRGVKNGDIKVGKATVTALVKRAKTVVAKTVKVVKVIKSGEIKVEKIVAAALVKRAKAVGTAVKNAAKTTVKIIRGIKSGEINVKKNRCERPCKKCKSRRKGDGKSCLRR